MLIVEGCIKMLLKYVKLVICFICGLFFIVSLIGLYNFLKNRPMVSFVMPTYNRADLLPRAIDSILKQTFEDFELVIVDDGSTDNTKEILKRYQKKDARIRVIFSKPNKGVAVARQIGNEAARGKYIAIMDSDDYLYPIFLERGIRFLEENEDVTILKLEPNYYFEGSDPENNFKHTYPIHQILFESRIANVGNIFRRDFIIKNKILYNMNYKCGEDYDFWIKMLKKGATLRYLSSSEVFYNIRLHKQNQYKDCQNNVLKVRNGFYNFLSIPTEKREDKCFIFKKAIEANPALFDAQIIRDAEKTYCLPDEYHIALTHATWNDFVLFSKDKTRIERYSKEEEKGTVISFVPGKEIKIRWDKWETETFIYTQEGVYLFSDLLQLKHPQWSDSIVLSQENKRCKRLNILEEEGTVISFVPGKEIKIKWDKWGTETFIYTQEGVYLFGDLLQLKHPQWSDSIVLSQENKRCKRLNMLEEEGTVISFVPEKEIEIKWDKWGTETFKFIDGIYKFEIK